MRIGLCSRLDDDVSCGVVARVEIRVPEPGVGEEVVRVEVGVVGRARVPCERPLDEVALLLLGEEGGEDNEACLSARLGMDRMVRELWHTGDLRDGVCAGGR